MMFGYPDWFCRPRLASALVFLVCGAGMLSAPVAAFAQVGFQVVPAGPLGNAGFESGTYLPTERTLTRGLLEAQNRIAAGEYTAAIEFLQDILEREDDSFVSVSGTPPRMVGLKAVARQLIADLPPEGMAAYQLQQSAAAQRDLERAIERADAAAVERVMRRYFYTPAGYEAALLVARAALDRGHPHSAVRAYEQLLDAPQAHDQFGPQLALLAAAGYLAAGNQQRAAELLASATAGGAAPDVVVAGQTRRLGDGTITALGNLDPHLAQSCTSASGPGDWCSLRGNASGNGRYPGGPPHMRPRWRARVVNHPRLESYVRERQHQLTRSGVPLIPAGSALAVGDVVLFKTPRTVVAVEWRTGKRIWETRSHGDPQLTRMLEESTEGNIETDMAALGHPLDERFWSDYLAAALSSDGERVYTIRDLPTGTGPARYRGRTLTLAGQHMIFGSLTNRLSAYELASEGKLVWEIDGRRDQQGLTGAFFLGTPVAVDGELYVLAEIKSAIYLVALDPDNGEVVWKQPLVSLERGVQLDVQRAQAGPEPAHAEGMVVCPTSAGAVVAVDLLTRSLAWAHLYAQDDPLADRDARAWNPRPDAMGQPADAGWADGSVLIAEGRVVVTPRDSAKLLCLDLTNGELLWQHDRRDGLYVGGIDQGTVLVVGQNGVRGLRLADGTPAWDELARPLPDEAMPTGRGVLSEGRYFLPLSTGSIVAVDMSTGELQVATEPSDDTLLGNLIWHHGAIVSQSALTVDKFDQRSVLLQRTNAALARNEDDADALRDRGEIALASGEFQSAAADLKRAYNIHPADLLTQELLTEALLELLATDYDAYSHEVPLLDELVDDPQTRFELLRLKARGLTRAGQPLAAFDVLLELAESDAKLDEMFAVSPERRVRGARWLRARLSRLFEKVSGDDSSNIHRRLAEVRDEIVQTAPYRQLQDYLERYDGLPGSGSVVVQMVRQLLARQEFGRAELTLLRLAESDQPEVRAATAALALQLLEGPAAAGDWDYYFQTLSDCDPETVLHDGRTVAEWLAGLTSRRPAQPAASGSWAANQIDVEVEPVNGRARQRAARTGQERPPAAALRMEQVRHAQLGNDAFFVGNDLDELIVQDAWGEATRRIDLGTGQENMLRRRSDRKSIFAARLGHLVVVSLGREAVAIDTRAATDAGLTNVLWRHPLVSQRTTRGAMARQRPSSGPFADVSQRTRLVNSDGEVLGALGPVTPRGVVLYDGEALVCLDPWTGEVEWSRADVPPGCELFGDEQRVFARPPHESSLLVYDLMDGRSLGTRPLPAGQWLVASGCHLATLERPSTGETHLKVTDVWTGKTLLERSLQRGVQFWVQDPHCVAVLEPSGQLEWIDVAAGRLVWDAALRPEPNLRGLYVMDDGSRLYVLTDRPAGRRPETRVSVADATYPLVTGNVYALNPQSGQLLWEEPAEVVQEGLALYQPARAPLLTFISRVNMQQRGRGNTSRLRLLCLDKATGQVVVENDALEDGPGGRFHVGVRPGEELVMVVDTPLADVRLTLTDTPLEQEEADAAERDTAEGDAAPESALWKLGNQLGKQFLEAWEQAREAESEAPAPAEPAAEEQP